MEERSNTIQTDLNLSHALIRRIGGGLSPIVSFYNKTATAAAEAIISFVCPKETNQRKRHPDTALIPQNALFFGFARNSLRSNTALTDLKKSALYGYAIRGIKPARITDQPKVTQWKKAA